MATREEIQRRERLAARVHQFTEEFDTWVNGGFKQLATKVNDLVVDTNGLVKQCKEQLAIIETCIKLTDDLVVLTAMAAERSREALQKIELKLGVRNVN